MRSQKNLQEDTKSELTLPQSNMLIYRTEHCTKIAIRPLGTKPKIKFYFSVKAPLHRVKDYPSVRSPLDSKIQNLIHEMKLS